MLRAGQRVGSERTVRPTHSGAGAVSGMPIAQWYPKTPRYPKRPCWFYRPRSSNEVGLIRLTAPGHRSW